MDRQGMQDLIDEPQPFKLTPGFIVFLTALFLPMILALAVYLGAWAVSSEVHSAEAASQGLRGSSAQTASQQDAQVAGWKKSLVGICPVH
jgi:hypothetical protein